MGKLKLSSEMKEKFEAAVTGGGGSRRDSMKSSNEDEVGKLGEDRKKILEQKLRGGSSSGGGGAGESRHKPYHSCKNALPAVVPTCGFALHCTSAHPTEVEIEVGMF